MQSYHKIGDEPLEWKGRFALYILNHTKQVQVEQMNWLLNIDYEQYNVLLIRIIPNRP